MDSWRSSLQEFFHMTVDCHNKDFHQSFAVLPVVDWGPVPVDFAIFGITEQ